MKFATWTPTPYILRAMDCPACKFYPHQLETKSKVRIFWGWFTNDIGNVITICKAIEFCNKHELQIVDISNFANPRGSRKLGRLKDALPYLRELPFVSLENQEKRARNQPGLTIGTSSFVKEGIHSELRSKYRGRPLPFLEPLYKLESRMLDRVARKLDSKLRLIEFGEEEIWIIENGRFSYQRVILQMARQLEIKTLFYDGSSIASSNENFYLRPYTPHSRIARAEAFNKWRVRTVSKPKLETATRWFIERSKDSSANVFNVGFTDSFPKFKNEKLAVFFTSSSDEFESFWREWTTFEWSSQYESFDAIASHLKKTYRLVIRIHPNLMNKSTPDVSSEFYQALRLAIDHGVELVLPDSNISTYDLISKSDLVIVSQSTVGLEALNMGKRVVATANCFFDACEDLLLFKKTSNVKSIDSHALGKPMDPQFAREFVLFELDSDYEGKSIPVGESTFLEKLFSLSYPRNSIYFLSWCLSSTIDRLLRPLVRIFYLIQIRRSRVKFH
jgi:hypothetical protein